MKTVNVNKSGRLSQQTAEHFSVLKVIISAIQDNLCISLLLITVIAGAILFALLPPLVLEQIVNSLAAGQTVGFFIAAAYFLITAVSGLLDAGKEIMITVFGQKVTHRIRTVMSEKLNRLPASWFIENEPGAAASRFVNDVNTIESLFASGIISMAADICKLAGILIVIFTRSTGLGVMLLAVTPALFLMTRIFQKRMLKAQLEGRIAVGRTSQQIPETLKNIRTIRILHQEDYMLKRYGKTIEQGFQAQERSNFYDAIYSPIIISVSALLTGIMMAASAQSGAVQQFFGMSAGTAAAVIAYVGSFFDPLESIGMEIQNIQSAAAGIRRISEFLKETEQKKSPDQEPEHPAEQKAERNAAVCLRGVSFRYKEGEQEILHNFNLIVSQGESVILAGRTGAGKSTLIKLIAGLYPPIQGSVTIFGRSPGSIPETEKRHLFGYVEQQFHRIPGTVGDQVSLLDPQVSDEQIEQALCLTGLSETVSCLPEGIHTPCTENLFSQGQFQLLSIARAVVLNPKLLLLDEITANLDSATEAQVLDALEAASRNRTVISISHRLYDREIQRGARLITL
ncbi:MAG: ABC transporter ATP-binding protein [Lachnospiraceae bacterium]